MNLPVLAQIVGAALVVAALYLAFGLEVSMGVAGVALVAVGTLAEQAPDIRSPRRDRDAERYTS